jgi:urea transport system permease protein
MLRLFTGDRGGGIMLALLGIACVVVPVFNLLVPESSWLHLSTYTVTLWGKYLTYALLAIALDLIWGYCGILSLGHSAFFALGGYAMGMYLMRQIGPRGVYGHPVLPDFMVFLNWQELPWYWYGSDQFWFALSMVVLVPGLLAFVFGWLAFRSRVTGVYLSIITQALTYALLLAFFRNDMGFGGNNGLTDFKDILGFWALMCRRLAPALCFLLSRRSPWHSAISPAAPSSIVSLDGWLWPSAMPRIAPASSVTRWSYSSSGHSYSLRCWPGSPVPYTSLR